MATLLNTAFKILILNIVPFTDYAKLPEYNSVMAGLKIIKLETKISNFLCEAKIARVASQTLLRTAKF